METKKRVHIHGHHEKSKTSKRGKWHVILTVPHATCPVESVDNNIHPCDTVAHDMAIMIQQALQNISIDSYLIKGDLPRDVLDLNRFESRNSNLTNFRNKIRSEINTYYPRALVLDIHSYPLEKYEWANYNMVILDSSNEILSFGRYLRDMIAKLDDGEKINCLHVSTSRVNDIMDEAIYEYDLHAVLLEFNESVVRKDRFRMVTTLTNLIKKFISD
jgi:hypothetical protein